MTIKHTSQRVIAFTTAVAGILIACSADDPNGTTLGGAGGETAGGSSGAGAAGMAQAGSSGASTMAGSTAIAGSGGAGGAGGAAGGGGAGGAKTGGAAGKAGAGGTPPVQPTEVCDIDAEATGMGKITYERWLAVDGIGVGLIPMNTAPATTLELTQLKQGASQLDSFGARIRGYLTAPLSGAYQFFINCDDNCELSLSTSESPANKVRLAWVEGPDAWTSDQEWQKSSTQRTAQAVMLEKDERYYIEVLHKEGIGGDHVGVGWLLPGEKGFKPCEIVPGTVLSPYDDPVSGSGGEGGGEP